MFESSAHERRLDMKKASTTKSDQDIPELKREQLGVGVRGKYFKHITQGSPVVVLLSEIQEAFPTSEAVNKALASMLPLRDAEPDTLEGSAPQAVCRLASDVSSLSVVLQNNADIRSSQ